jgi:hypothetical protein
MEVNTMVEGEIIDVTEEEVVMEDIDYAKVKNKDMKPKKRVAGETEPAFSSDEDLRAQFSTARTRKKTKNIFKRWHEAE